MLTSLLNTCTDCTSLEDAMCEMDGAIAQSSKNAYNNLVYLSNHKTEACDIMRLIWYREILTQLKGNPNYYCDCLTFEAIVSRARALVAGIPKIAKRWSTTVNPIVEPVPWNSLIHTTTTTSTSTTSTTTS